MSWADLATVAMWFMGAWASGYTAGYLFKVVRRLLEAIGGAGG